MSALTSTAVLVMVIIGASCESSGTKTRVRSPDDTLNLSPVPIVGNDGPGFPDARLLSLREDLRLGTSFGPSELEFQQVRVIATDRAGNIYVGNNGSGQIRVFDHEGRFLRSVGRVGDGPGDFRSFAYLFFIGDTL
ncbi:MAG: 6-bladed beta-propeller, partial [Gemmatimonadota bacterium]